MYVVVMSITMAFKCGTPKKQCRLSRIPLDVIQLRTPSGTPGDESIATALLHGFAGWWFGTCFIFPYIWNNHPNWLFFFRGFQTTNQIMTMRWLRYPYPSHIPPEGDIFTPPATDPLLHWSTSRGESNTGEGRQIASLKQYQTTDLLMSWW